ncbi:MAG TPA: hypothetical protein VGH74_07750 [Planctomycetaceae bacterium]|jgi:hypothetical protein
MNNDSIFSGVKAYPAREVADLLHGRGWASNNADFLALVGAVTTLAREVADMSKAVDSFKRTENGCAEMLGRPFPYPEAGAPRMPANAPLPPLPSPAEQLALVYEGLREVRAMIHTGLAMLTGSSPETAQARGGLLQAIDLRLAAMLEAANEPTGGDR